MESLSDVLRYLITAVEGMGIPYALGGSIASMAYGEARSTRDIDIIVVLSANDVGRLRKAFPATEFYFDELTARDAIRDRTQFNIIHPESGLKIDVYIPGDPIARSQVEHALSQLAIGDVEAKFSPPEELIVKKLTYHSAGGGDRHIQDITAMFQVSGDKIDPERVTRLAEMAGVGELWQTLRARIDV